MSAKTDVANLQRSLNRLQNGLVKSLNMGVRKIAMHAYKRLIQETPKGHTGQTRRSWKLLNIGSGNVLGFSVGNESRVMKFLEYGTKAHGPRTAKNLFIPLNRKTALGGLTKSSKFGRDYVFAKKVSGIKPMGITKKRSRIVDRQVDAMISATLAQITSIMR